MDELTANGIFLTAISYDRVEILAQFAQENEITYPLLSDQGSEVISRLGLLNQNVAAQHHVYGGVEKAHHRGIPYPGVFVLNNSGLIVNKVFHQSYRERESGPALLEQIVGIAAPPGANAILAGDDAVAYQIWTDSTSYAWFQRFHVLAEISIQEGFHVYAEPAPPGFHVLDLRIDPKSGLRVGRAKWPAARSFQMKGLDEQFYVYEGTVRGSIPLVVTAESVEGLLQVVGTLAYQVCSDVDCALPMVVPFELPLTQHSL